MDPFPIKGISFGLVYVDDFDRAVEFYQHYFGFKKEFDMGPESCYGKTGDAGLWIGGGYQRSQLTDQSTRCAFMWEVESAWKLFEQFKNDGVKVFKEEPMKMAEHMYWFEFTDPSGNILEVLGGK